MRVLRPAAALLLLLIFIAVEARAADVKPARPNIIVILSDDMGHSDLGCYGSEIHTPNLDALAAGGLRFTQFYNTARCCPSRAALLTGLYSHQAGVGHMTELHPDFDGYVGDLNSHCVTIAQVLKPAGYATVMVGKWHVTRFATPAGPKDNWPLQRGFDRYYGTIIGAGSFFDPGMLTRDNTNISPFNDPEYKPEQYYYTDALSEHAVRFIEEHHQQHAAEPFFLYAAYTAAHWPMQAPDKEIAKYKGKYDGGYEPIRKARMEKMKELGLVDPNWELSPQAGEWEKVTNKEWEARCMEVYAAMIDDMDQGIGRIVETLKRTGQLDNTLILFMQDNGGNYEPTGRNGNQTRPAAPTFPIHAPEFIETATIPKQMRNGFPVLQGTGVMPGTADTYIAYGRNWGNVSNTPFREYKHFVHEGGIATPLVAHWPAGIARKGELEKQPGHLIDVMATCVALSGAAYPKQFKGSEITPLEGRSLLPAFDRKPIERDALYWEHEGNRAVRQGNWKLVAKGAAGAWELYDMSADRTEMHDLATSEPQRVAALKAKWEAWAKRAHVLPWISKPAYGEASKPGVSGPATLTLKAGADLAKDQAPNFVGKTITLTATLQKLGTDGVIVAHGGSRVGYSLYVKGGKPAFAVRRDGEMTVIEGSDVLEPGSLHVKATLAGDGTMTLSAGEKTIVTGKSPGLLEQIPGDGLQVGSDKGAAVGDYKAPFPFNGEITEVKIELLDPTTK